MSPELPSDLTNATGEFIVPTSSQRTVRLPDHSGCAVPAKPAHGASKKRYGALMGKKARQLRIATVDDYGMAVLIVERLRGVGVHVMDVEASSHISLAGAEQFYFIEIADKNQVEEARKALVDWGYKRYVL
jgi:hypothetical protein